MPAASSALMVQTTIVVHEIMASARGSNIRRLSSLQHQGSYDTDEKESDDLDKHVGGSVTLRKSMPVPIGNVCRDSGKDTGDRNKKDAAARAEKLRGSKEKHNQDCFEDFGCELYAQ